MRSTSVLIAAALVCSASAAPAVARTSADAKHHPNRAESEAQTGRSAMLHTPESIASEHRELHETLARATNQRGDLGTSARELERVLAPHFKREEEIATPPLGLLPELAKGSVTPDMKEVLPLTQALERELPQMLREHEAIRLAAKRFKAAAERSGRAEYVRFADQLAAHAAQEEQILYPAAVLVGRYVSLAAAKR